MRNHTVEFINEAEPPRRYRVTVRDPGPVSSCICTVYHNGKAMVMWVDSVETTAEFRHRGYATLLMEKVVELAQDLGVDSVELVANGSDETAKRLYGRAGLAPTDKQHRRRILNRWPTKT